MKTIETNANSYLAATAAMVSTSSEPWAGIRTGYQERMITYLGNSLEVLSPLLVALKEAGWSIRHIKPDTNSQTLRETGAAIGLVYFSTSSNYQSLCHLISDMPLQMRWVALLDAHESEAELLAWVGRYCHDFYRIPLDADLLIHTLGHAWGMGKLTSIEGPQTEFEYKSERDMVGSSPCMLELFSNIRKISHTDCAVLVRGETGTGKELCALAVHAHSRRANSPFVAVNCGALPPELIQSELFGHEKGAFTGAHQRKLGLIETAAGGTLFLDEIGDLPLGMQVHLLRFLQEGQLTRVGGTQTISVDVRIVAATHVNLEQAVAEGRFREDLMFRLNVIPLNVPTLRERAGDAVLLARYFLECFRHESRRQILGFTDEALQSLDKHPWPGNVRELINRVHRAVVMCDHKFISPRDLGLSSQAVGRILTLEDARVKAEHDAIQFALSRSGNNVSEAARHLGVSRATLYRLLQRLDMASLENGLGQRIE